MVSGIRFDTACERHIGCARPPTILPSFVHAGVTDAVSRRERGTQHHAHEGTLKGPVLTRSEAEETAHPLSSTLAIRVCDTPHGNWANRCCWELMPVGWSR